MICIEAFWCQKNVDPPTPPPPPHLPPLSFDVRDRPVANAQVYSDQTLFDEPTRAVMKVNGEKTRERIREDRRGED